MNFFSNLFSFPDPVNDNAARIVATWVVALSLIIIFTKENFLVYILFYGFLARVLTGPTLSPIGYISMKFIAPKFGAPKHVPGIPKRFAQGIGLGFASAILLLTLFSSGSQWEYYTESYNIVLGTLALFAAIEAFIGFCTGCWVFGLLMKTGIIPKKICEKCVY